MKNMDIIAVACWRFQQAINTKNIIADFSIAMPYHQFSAEQQEMKEKETKKKIKKGNKKAYSLAHGSDQN